MDSIIKPDNSKNFNIHCHTHSRCNSLSIQAKKELVEEIFQKQEEKLVNSVKQLVADIKEEILTEISSCNLKKSFQKNPESVGSNDSSETLSFPLTLSELEDSSEVEYDYSICIGNRKNKDDCDNHSLASGKKRKMGNEKVFINKRQRSDDGSLKAYNYNTPTRFCSSSPVERTKVAKALNFSSCSSESEDSVLSFIENEDIVDSESNDFLRKKWVGSASLNVRSESPESLERSEGSERTLQVNCFSGEGSPNSSNHSASFGSDSTENNDNVSCDEDEPEEEVCFDDPYYDIPLTSTIPYNLWKYECQLETISEEDEDIGNSE